MKDYDNLDSVSYKRSLVIGTLLGRGYSRIVPDQGKQKAEVVICHGIEQEDLVEWKAREIERLYGKKVVVHRNLVKKQVYFGLTQGKRLRVIHDWFHSGCRKVITDKIRFLDHPVGLAMLLCDSGSVRKRKKQHKDGTVYYLKPCLTIAVYEFDLESVKRLLDHIECFCGAKGEISREQRWRSGELKTYNRIIFNPDNSQRLWDFVSVWIPRVPSMLSKFSYAIERFGMSDNGKHPNR